MTFTTKTSITQLGPRGLKELKTGPAMKIYFQPNGESEKVILSDTFPRKVGVTFSQAIKDQAQGQNISGSSFTITSGDKVTVTTVLRWMMTSCNGFGLTSFEPQATFSEILSYLQTANDLEIPALSNILHDRLENRISNPVIEDAHAIYSLLDSKHHLRIQFVQTVSECIETRTLKNWSEFIKFAAENKEYASEVEECRKILDTPKVKAQRIAQRELNRAYWATLKADRHEAQKKIREDLKKQKEEWKRTHGFAGKGFKSRKMPNGKPSKGVTRGVNSSTRVRVVTASEDDTASTTAQPKTSATDNATIGKTPQTETQPATVTRPKAAITLDLTKAQPTLTIGNVTKEIPPIVTIDGAKEAVNVKPLKDSTENVKPLKDSAKNVNEGKEGKRVKHDKDNDEKVKEDTH